MTWLDLKKKVESQQETHPIQRLLRFVPVTLQHFWVGSCPSAGSYKPAQDDLGMHVFEPCFRGERLRRPQQDDSLQQLTEHPSLGLGSLAALFSFRQKAMDAE